MRQNYLILILICLAGAGGAGAGAPVVAAQEAGATDSVQTIRRLATTARLAAEEYRLGVRDGKVVLEPEVEEARLFLGEARSAAGRLPAAWAAPTAAELSRLLELVERTGSPDSVAAGVERVVTALAQAFSVELDEIPEHAPSLARGAEIYRQQCAACHGVMGRADGPQAAGLDPAPAILADAEALAGSSPLDFYRRVTIGVAGTAMPAYETLLSPADRWAVALYASTLRLPPPRGRVPAGLERFAVTASLSDEALADSLGGGGLARVAAVRAATGTADFGALFALVRARVDSSVALAEAGQADQARSRALDAYMAFEAVERQLRVKEPALVARLEAGFTGLRTAASGAEARAVRGELLPALARAEEVTAGTLSPVALFLQSVIILVREGLEAILVVGALMAFLVKMGAGHRRRDIHLGVGAALVASLLVAVAIETVFRISPANQEALEALTMVAATVMLFWVSYWLLSKIEVARWNQFVKTRLSEALNRRSGLALASVAFLAVFREGFETVLFYKALVVSGGGGATAGMPVALGFVAAAVLLAIVYVAINRFGVRLPLRPFFAVTSALLYLMAFNFAGTAIAELQEGGFLPLTPVTWLPHIPVLGMYPTVESALAQAALLALALLALVWTFVVSPRRAAVAVRG
jgi:high-affinity iron transporter